MEITLKVWSNEEAESFPLIPEVLSILHVCSLCSFFIISCKQEKTENIQQIGEKENWYTRSNSPLFGLLQLYSQASAHYRQAANLKGPLHMVCKAED